MCSLGYMYSIALLVKRFENIPRFKTFLITEQFWLLLSLITDFWSNESKSVWVLWEQRWAKVLVHVDFLLCFLDPRIIIIWSTTIFLIYLENWLLLSNGCTILGGTLIGRSPNVYCLEVGVLIALTHVHTYYHTCPWEERVDFRSLPANNRRTVHLSSPAAVINLISTPQWGPTIGSCYLWVQNRRT